MAQATLQFYGSICGRPLAECVYVQQVAGQVYLWVYKLHGTNLTDQWIHDSYLYFLINN